MAVPAWRMRVAAVFRHESRIAAYSAMTPVAALGLLLSLVICVFVVADFLAADEASVRLLAVFTPWVAVVFVPTLAMRSWNGGDGRAAQFVLSLPLGDGALVLGWFLARFAVLILILAATAGFPVTAYYLGTPDSGSVLGTYLGVAAMFAAFLALSLLAAQCCNEAMSAFVAGVCVLFVVVLLGNASTARVLGDWIAPEVVDIFVGAGPGRWIDGLASGRVGLGAVFYFATMCALSLAAAWYLAGRRRRAPAPLRTAVHGAVLMVGVVAASAIGANVGDRLPWSIDLTDQREHTPAAPTVAILRTLPDEIHITYYWSAAVDGIPVPIRTHARRVRAFFEAWERLSHGRIHLHEVDPEPDSDAELRAMGGGIRRVPLSSGDKFFLGARLRRGERTLALPYFDPERAHLLEFDALAALYALVRERPPRIGILSPLVAPTALREGREGLSFLSDLRTRSDVAVVPYFAAELPEKLDVVVVIDAAVLKRSMLGSIDRFVAAGGALVVLLDPFARFNRAGQQVRIEPSANIDDITDLLSAWGITYRGEHVVGDQTLASTVAIEGGAATGYPYWIRAAGAALSGDHPVTAMLREVLLVEPGELVVADRVQPLITTTGQSGVLARERFLESSPASVTAAFEPDGRRRVLAAYVHGPLPGAFDRSTGSAQARVFVVADVDWIFDPFSVERVTGGGQPSTRPVNHNHAFLANLIDFAGGAPGLAVVRTRGGIRRPFTRFERLFKVGEGDVGEELGSLARTLAEGEQHIGELAASVGASSLDELRGPVADTVAQITARLLPLRKRQRALRAQARARVDALRSALLIANFALPVVLVLGLTAAAHLRRVR